MIALNIPDEKAKEIVQYAYYKKMTGNWIPDADPIDWLALEVIRALHLNETDETRRAIGDAS